MTFDELIDFIIDRIEMGYANDPRDNGGETNWGISVRAHPELRGRIHTLSREEAKKIYHSDYFLPASIAQYPVKMRLAVLDGAINHGVVSNNRLVQRTLYQLGHKLLVDGVIGPITLASLQKTDALIFLASYCGRRLAFYKKLPDYTWAGASWEYRLFLVCAAS